MADTKDEKLLDLKNSKLRLDGTEKDHKHWLKVITNSYEDLKQDQTARRRMNQKRKDFYEGNQSSYSNVVGIVKDGKLKKGHTNQVTNYAGKTVVKTAYSLANNPPKLTVPGTDPSDEMEAVRAQAVEDFIDSVFDDPKNRFWKKTYRRGCFVQGMYGDYGIRIFVDADETIRLVGHDNTTNLLVGWNNLDPDSFDFVMSESYLTAEAIESEYGIKVNPTGLQKVIKSKEDREGIGTWENNNNWGTKSPATSTKPELPDGKNNLPKLKVIDYDCPECYCIKIEDTLVQYVKKDDETFPKMPLWTIVKNIPNPPSPWSIADLDYLIEPQIELNDNNNRTSDYLRVGSAQRYVGYNLGDFDPESIKTGSGQVILLNDPDGRSRFEPLPTNVNNFPADQYHQRIMQQMYDLGLPKVNFGASGADSGRSKAIDYQSSVDVTIHKRDSWELALQDICAKIQILGNFLYGERIDWFTNESEEFIVREVEFDWSDIVPITASDKIVNIANKVNMIGLPIKQAYKELGYRNPDQLFKMLQDELKDPAMMIVRSKMWQLAEGLMMAQQQAAAANEAAQPAPASVPGAPDVNQAAPTLTPEQNSPSAKPMASRGGTTSFSSPRGFIDRTRQNLQAQGR